MNRFVAIIVLCAVLAQCLLQLGVVGYYQINKNYIAKNLCENRDKPQMKCCGKCYLRKQLKKADDANGSQKQSSKTEKYELVVFVLPAALSTNVISRLFTSSIQHPASQDMHDVAALSSIFHPPGIAC